MGIPFGDNGNHNACQCLPSNVNSSSEIASISGFYLLFAFFLQSGPCTYLSTEASDVNVLFCDSVIDNLINPSTVSRSYELKDFTLTVFHSCFHVKSLCHCLVYCIVYLCFIMFLYSVILPVELCVCVCLINRNQPRYVLKSNPSHCQIATMSTCHFCHSLPQRPIEFQGGEKKNGWNIRMRKNGMLI